MIFYVRTDINVFKYHYIKSINVGRYVYLFLEETWKLKCVRFIKCSEIGILSYKITIKKTRVNTDYRYTYSIHRFRKIDKNCVSAPLKSKSTVQLILHLDSAVARFVVHCTAFQNGMQFKV